MFWSESSPPKSISARGWLWASPEDQADHHTSSLGFYLDYGPETYRSPHEYCHPKQCTCPLTMPGSILAVAYQPDGMRTSRYCETVEQARAWIEEVTAVAALA